MVRITQTHSDEDSVGFKVDGILDRNCLDTLEQVLESHLKKGRRISIDLEGIIHADQDGVAWLRKYSDRMKMEGLSEFLRLEIGYPE